MHREAAEQFISNGVQWLRLAVELIGAIIIGLGVVIGFATFVISAVRAREVKFNAIRLTVARYLALGLEFQLAADILSTAIAPSWNEIGKLGAIAVIRTGLNYFLSREMREERATEEAEQRVERAAAGG